MTYGYARVSTSTQNLERQLDELIKEGINTKNIFTDKQSGVDFERIQYQKLRKKLKENDLLIIKSIDRLGRNYQMIVDEWYHITKVLKANIRVLDIPLLDTSYTDSDLVGQFIRDIVLQILSYIAENERTNIRQRQAEGIRLAKARGVHMGRPCVKLPDNFSEVSDLYKHRLITVKEAIKRLSMTRPTFIKYHNKRLSK